MGPDMKKNKGGKRKNLEIRYVQRLKRIFEKHDNSVPLLQFGIWEGPRGGNLPP